MKKEKQDRLAQDAHPPNGYAGQTRQHDGSYGSGPMRGGYMHGNSGHRPYHPYQRAHPVYGATKFKNKTVVFNRPEGSAALHGIQTTTPGSRLSHDNTSHSTLSSQQQTEPKTLCPALTSTGISDDTANRYPFLDWTGLTPCRCVFSPRLPPCARPEQAGTVQAMALQG
jgi:hypothetical protein